MVSQAAPPEHRMFLQILLSLGFKNVVDQPKKTLTARLWLARNIAGRCI